MLYVIIYSFEFKVEVQRSYSLKMVNFPLQSFSFFIFTVTFKNFTKKISY